MSAHRNLLSIAFAVLLSSSAAAQPSPELIQQMIGQWDVQQRMWPGPKAAAVDLPAASAKRQLVGDTCVEEVMESAGGAGQSDHFVRRALLNYNAVSRRYEYTSFDTRGPQLMTEIGAPTGPKATADGLHLDGSTFVAPQWGNAKNVRFKYRLVVGRIEQDKQRVALFLTPLSAMPKVEFMAFEYVYTRR